MKIIGNLICQNGVGEVLRCIESLVPVVDEYIVVDGYSTDGTWEILNRFKKAYNLTLYQRKFDRMDNQRNFALEKSEKDNWILTIDQDEQLNIVAQYQIKRFIDHIHPDIYVSPVRVSPISIGLPFYNLIHDKTHYSDLPLRMNNNKLIYYDRNLKFVDPYHSRACYDYDDPHYQNFPGPKDWAIFHYAFLDEERVKNAKADIKSGRRQYLESEWNLKKRPVFKIPMEVL